MSLILMELDSVVSVVKYSFPFTFNLTRKVNELPVEISKLTY